ncbi:MAG TPA: signal recognition particle-docking protein FtsY [Sandaracinaceae bacterium]
MDTGTLIGIVAAVVVVALLAWFLLRGKAPEALPPERKPEPRPPREPEARPEPTEAAAEAKAEAEAKPSPAAPEAEAEPPKAAVEAQAEPPRAAAEAQPEAAPEARAEAKAEPAQAEPKPAPKPSDEDVKALKKGLASTRGGFIARLAKLFGKKTEIDPALLDEMQEVLITADIGVKTSEKILERLKARLEKNELADEEQVWAALREEAREILSTRGRELALRHTPSVILVVGVNGVGKTTTIGKLASRYKEAGKKVILAAGDTFRAAAVLQLEVWGRRVGCEVVKGKERADPASVIFDAIKKAKNEGADLVIADTAGRLHTKTNLMEELKKVVRTAEKALERPVDEILLVLDSTTGQNAIQQAQLFKEAIPVSGIALTKLDGTAKGGVILGIVDQHDLPVHFVGIGERVEDLREFDASTFVEALFAKPDDESMAA